MSGEIIFFFSDYLAVRCECFVQFRIDCLDSRKTVEIELVSYAFEALMDAGTHKA